MQQPSLSRSQFARNIYRMLRYMWTHMAGGIILQWGLYVVKALLPAATVYVSLHLVDAVAGIIQGKQDQVKTAILLVVASAGLTLLSTGLGSLLGLQSKTMEARASLRAQVDIFEKAGRLPVSFYDEPSNHDLLQRISGNIGFRIVQVSSTMIGVLATLVTLSSYLILVANAHWSVPLVFLLVLAIALLINIRLGGERFKMAWHQTPMRRHMSYLETTLTAHMAAKEVRLYGIREYLIERWRDIAGSDWKTQLNLVWRQTRIGVGLEAISATLGNSLIILLVLSVSGGDLTLGQYVAFGSAIMAGLGEVKNLSAGISQVYEQGLFVQDLFTFFDLPETENYGTDQFPPVLEEGIRVEGLCFSYPGTQSSILKDVSFTIRPGERVAIIGENGSGKTTLVKCLLGLYHPTEGSIRYDGLEVNRIQQSSLWANVTAIFQDFMRYALSARENVGFGNLDRMADVQELARVLDMADATGVLRRLPNGWETPLSRMWPGGVDLSYGQWQKLATARAFLRDAQVIVLDEPTASMDPKAESQIYEQLASTMTHRTAIFISHRLGMTRFADRILVLKDGCLVEQGTHAELINYNGEYARLFKLQAQWYL